MEKHRYSVGIVPTMTNMKVIIFDHQKEELKEYEGNMFESIAWINKRVNLNQSIAIIQNVEMMSEKFRIFNNMKSHIEKLMKYLKWKKNPTKRIPNERYDFPQLQSDFFNVLKDHHETVAKQTVQKIITEAFKMRGVLVIGCDETPVEEKVREKIRFNSKIPATIPGGPNDNLFIIKSK